VSGIEINPAIVDQARRLLIEDGLGLVELTVGSIADVLPGLDSDSQDVVFSCFALAYLPPGQLLEVLDEALRVARVGLVIVEPHVREDQRPGLLRETVGWRHDYAASFRRLGVERHAMRMIELPQGPRPLNGCLVLDLRQAA
jgi:ubiquinone/menaquinone biosynthesis C-methylase UbiE